MSTYLYPHKNVLKYNIHIQTHKTLNKFLCTAVNINRLTIKQQFRHNTSKNYKNNSFIGI